MTGKRAPLAAITGLILWGVAGCAPKSVAPTIVVERPVGVRDIDARAQTTQKGYVLVNAGRTAGRFATTIAVAKLAASDTNQLRLVELIPAEEGAWADALSTEAAIQDVQFLSPNSARPGPASTESLCASAAMRRASLLLVYAPNRRGLNNAQVNGILYDISDCRIVATFHAHAEFKNDEGVEVAPEPLEGDQRTTDALYQASRHFEHNVLTGLDALIRSDVPVTTTQPNSWQTPFNERWWIPSRIR